MKTCSIDGCGRPVLARGWCSKHYQRWINNGDPNTARPKAADGAGNINAAGYRVSREGGDRALEHVRIVERVLGRRLPPGAQVHHADGNPLNNANSNLVVCPSDEYHKLLHRRMRAFDACGHADYLRCVYCKRWGAPEAVVRHAPGSFVHRACYNEYKRLRYQRKKALHRGTPE